jgi:hypothetical protein
VGYFEVGFGLACTSWCAGAVAGDVDGAHGDEMVCMDCMVWEVLDGKLCETFGVYLVC